MASQHREIFRKDLFAKKRFLVTGGGSGLGKEITSHLAQLGATIYICGRRESVLQETATEINNEHSGLVIPVGLDIRSSTDVQARIDEIFSAGPLDGLVNNAAGNFVSPTHKLSARGFEAISNIVFRGSFYITHAVGCKWIEQGLPGSVVSILTTWVWTGSPFVVPSAMSKAGINVMTKSLAVEWGGFGIRLNAIAPGPFPTEGAWERLNIDGGSSTIAEERQEESERKIGPLSRVGPDARAQELDQLFAERWLRLLDRANHCFGWGSAFGFFGLCPHGGVVR